MGILQAGRIGAGYFIHFGEKDDLMPRFTLIRWEELIA